MVPTVFIYPIVLLALVCLFLILHARWSSNCPVAYRSLPKSLAPLCKPSKAPKPFAGLTHKPSCAACEEATPHDLAGYGLRRRTKRRAEQGMSLFRGAGVTSP